MRKAMPMTLDNHMAFKKKPSPVETLRLTQISASYLAAPAKCNV